MNAEGIYTVLVSHAVHVCAIYINSAIIFLNIFIIAGCFQNYAGKTFHSV